MDDFMKNFENFLDSNQIPENMKDMINSMLKNSNQSSNTINESNISNSENTNPNSSGIDIETLLKIQKIMKSMNNEQSNTRANLLRSLKPYLRPSRQDKVDQYIQLLNLEKVIQLFNETGGDKDDV